MPIRPRIFWIAVFYTTARLPEQQDYTPDTAPSSLDGRNKVYCTF